MFGLSRAFAQAGAQNILSSMWPVSDKESALLVDEFYANLRNAKDPSSAFATAQRNRMRALRESHSTGEAIKMIGGFRMHTMTGMR